MRLINLHIEIFIVGINSTTYKTNDDSIGSPIKTQNQSRSSFGTGQVRKWEWHQNDIAFLNGSVFYNHRPCINPAHLIKNQNRRRLN